MKFIIYLSLFFSPMAVFAGPKDSVAIKEVEELERKRFEAQVEKDYAFLEKVFAKDLIYTHSNGVVNTKEEYLQSIRDGKSLYDKIDVEALKLRAYNKGETVVINGTINVLQRPKNAEPQQLHLRYAVVYIKKKEGWQLVMWQSLKLL